jgi:hypothetical protein
VAAASRTGDAHLEEIAMTTRSLFPLLLLSALSTLFGCSSKGDDSSGVPANAMKLDTIEDVATAYVLSSGPEMGFLVTALLVAFGKEGSCPSLLSDEANATYTLTGGCTDDDGTTYTGSATMAADGADASFTFTAFGFADADTSASWDGSLQLVAIDDANSRLTTHDLDFAVGGLKKGSASLTNLEASYLDYTVEIPSDLFGGAGDTTIDATIVESTLGSFTISGTQHEEPKVCDSEPESGVFTFVGDGTATITFDGATNCDGCSVVTLPDGTTDSFCEDAPFGA